MRVLRDHQGCVCAVQSYPPTAQHSPVARAQQLWDEWEIQCLVLVSFSLQVVLLFAAGFRKRHRSRVLSVLLWLAYLSAESVVVFVLGRFTFIYTGDPRHQLVLFWVPFLVLHLGGQEAIAAYSMEDCALWKRHLLNLATQSALAVYVVGKQWRGDKQLVAPTVLMFFAGTIKYAERTWVLKRASSAAHGSSFVAPPGYKQWDEGRFYPMLVTFIREKRWQKFEHIMKLTARGFRLSFNFFMDFHPIETNFTREGFASRPEVASALKSSDSGTDMVYKQAEIHLSLIYDCLYNKFGCLTGVLLRLTTLFLTSTALARFAAARVDHKGRLANYSGADVIISYILLLGAITLEISSIFMWFMSSYWMYITIPWLLRNHRCRPFQCAGIILLSIARRLRPECRVEWSGKLPQYNMIDACIKEKQAGLVEQWMRSVGIERGYTTHAAISPVVKKLLLDQLLEIASLETSSCTAGELDFLTRFRGQWAQRWVSEAKRHHDHSAADQQASSSLNAAQKALRFSKIQVLDLATSALIWQIVTDICLLADETTDSSEFISSSRELSNYIMYLLAKCKVMLGSDGQDMLQSCRDGVLSYLGNKVPDRRESYLGKKVLDRRESYLGKKVLDRRELVQSVCDDSRISEQCGVLLRARLVSMELLKIEAGDRWKLIATVWMEMLCCIARNCGAGFHAKHLSTGGEFVTHVKILLFILCFPPRGDAEEQSLYPSTEEREEIEGLVRSKGGQREAKKLI